LISNQDNVSGMKEGCLHARGKPEPIQIAINDAHAQFKIVFF